MNNYLELTVYTTHLGGDLIADILWNYTDSGVVINDIEDVISLARDGKTWDYADESIFNAEKTVIVKAYFPLDTAYETIKLVERDIAQMQMESPLDLGTLETVKREIDGDLWREQWKEHFRPIPIGKIVIVPEWIDYKEKDGENVESEINKLIQLEPVDNLKYGVVANMVGVVAYLLKKFDYNVYISLEDLTKPFKSKVNGGLSGVPITITGENEGKRLDVERYAGLGLYNYFEIQLLKKLFRIQQSNNNIIHLVPSFRAAKNYEGKIDAEGKIKNRFGIVFFVEANATSIVCPKCDATNEDRNNNSKPKNVVRDKKNGNDILICNVCGFDTTKEYAENPLKYIKSGDDNAAYIMSTSAVKAYELATTVADNKSK
jgi:hypothetical protein